MNKKLLLIGAGLLVVLAPIAWLVFNRGGQKPPGVSLYSGLPVASNIKFPEPERDNKARFFTGSAVAELDLTNFASKGITREFSLPKALKFYWQGDRALVQFEQIKEYHDLAGYADQAGQSTSWWLFDIKAQDFRPLLSDDGVVVDAVWRDNSSYFAASAQDGSNSQAVGVYSVGGRLIERYGGSSNLVLVGNSTAGLIARRFDRLLIIKRDGEEILPISTSRMPVITGDGKLVVYESSVENEATFGRELKVKRGKIFSYGFESKSTVRLSEDNSGNYAVSSNSFLMFPPSSSMRSNTETSVTEGAVVDVSSGKTSALLRINEESLEQIGAVKEFIRVEQSAEKFDALLVDSTGKLFALSSDPSAENKKGVSPLIPFTKQSVGLSGGSMEYRVASNTLIVSTRDNRAATRNKVMSEIKNMGVDPHQVNKVWVSAHESIL
jgi:hypothetical protein